MECVLSTEALTKKYKRHLAVNGVNLHIDRGDIYGFVGENGSGKTTVIRLITGLISPTSGTFELFGVSNRARQITAVRRKMGAVVETPSVYLNLSAYDNLKTQGAVLGIDGDEKIRRVLEAVGLSELYGDKKKAGNFSLGMRQRLGIAMALLGEPEFLILDEPMNGLDPAGIVDVRELILKLNRERGITFLISSHILTELSLVATKYGIISHGRLIREITAEELRGECEKTTLLRASDPAALAEAVGALVENEVQLLPDGVKVLGEVDLTELLSGILSRGIRLDSVNCNQSSIEEFYLSLIGGAKA